MKGIIRALLAFVMAVPVAAQNAPGFSPPWAYSVNSDNSVTITGYEGAGGDVTVPTNINNMPVTGVGDEALTYLSDLTNLTIPDGVTTIGIEAFAFSTNFTSVALSASVTNIGDDAFFGCTKLTAITVSPPNPYYSSLDGVLFDSSQTTLIEFPCGRVGNYVIPASVASIGQYAFLDCTGLTNVTIPGSVTNIGDYAFSGCSNLASVVIPNGITSINDGEFLECTALASVTIPDSVTNICEFSFDVCTRLGNIAIPASVAGIGVNAFSSASGLTNVYFEGNAPSSDKFAFSGDYNATIYYLPGTGGWSSFFAGWPVLQVVPFDQNLLKYTTNADNTLTVTGYFGPLGPVLIPTNVNGMPVISIGDAAFFNSGVTTMTVPGGLTSIGNLAFYGSSNLANITIPESVTNIGSFAFYGCTKLAGVTIPDTVPNIGDATFYDCTNLQGVDMGLGVASVGSLAFYGCTSLSNVVIPEGVTNLGDEAFGDCTNLASVYFNGNAPAPGSSVFFSDNATAYYIIGNTGWTSVFAGLPVAVQIPYDYRTNADGTLSILGYSGLASDVTLPTNIDGVPVTAIGSFSVFDLNTAVTGVTIPASVTNIGEAPIYLSMSLRAITVDPQNPNYSSLNGVLFDKDQTTLIEYPDGVSGAYAIPSGVTSILDSAFAFSEVTTLTIPGSVTNIGDLFISCQWLNNVYFEGNAPSAGSYDFVYGAHETVYYLPGTTGWGSSYSGAATELWNPLIQTADGGFGVRNNLFGFNITGATNITLAVEACTNLADPIWAPLLTVTLTGGLVHFTDPQWTNYSGRYYRISFP